MAPMAKKLATSAASGIASSAGSVVQSAARGLLGAPTPATSLGSKVASVATPLAAGAIGTGVMALAGAGVALAGVVALATAPFAKGGKDGKQTRAMLGAAGVVGGATMAIGSPLVGAGSALLFGGAGAIGRAGAYIAGRTARATIKYAPQLALGVAADIGSDMLHVFSGGRLGRTGLIAKAAIAYGIGKALLPIAGDVYKGMLRGPADDVGNPMLSASANSKQRFEQSASGLSLSLQRTKGRVIY